MTVACVCSLRERPTRRRNAGSSYLTVWYLLFFLFFTLWADLLLFTEREDKKGHSPRKIPASPDSPLASSSASGIRGSQFRVRKIVPVSQLLLRDGRLRESQSDEKHIIDILQVEPHRKIAVVCA